MLCLQSSRDKSDKPLTRQGSQSFQPLAQFTVLACRVHRSARRVHLSGSLVHSRIDCVRTVGADSRAYAGHHQLGYAPARPVRGASLHPKRPRTGGSAHTARRRQVQLCCREAGIHQRSVIALMRAQLTRLVCRAHPRHLPPHLVSARPTRRGRARTRHSWGPTRSFASIGRSYDAASHSRCRAATAFSNVSLAFQPFDSASA